MYSHKQREACLQPFQILPGKKIHRNNGARPLPGNIHRLVQQNRGIKMKNTILYLVIILIVLSVLFVLFHPIKKTEPNIMTKTKTTFSTGKTEQTYKKGKDSITTKTKSIHNKVILKPFEKDSSYRFVKSDSLYDLSIKIKHESDSSFTLEYFLELTTKDLIRIDTIYQLRVDTLKIKETISERIDPPFYNTFLFGAVVSSSIILLLTILLR